MTLSQIQIGDTVTRVLGGNITDEFKVTGLTDDLVQCGPWEFDRATGAEIDAGLGWGPPPLPTGSFITTET